MKVSFPLLLAALAFPITGWAQAYKCTVNGSVVFQQTACAAGGEKLRVLAPPDPSSPEGLVAQGKVAISMTAEQVKRSWGAPTKVNKTITASGSSEQWVYDRGRNGASQYVYLTNGVVTSIQSPG